MTQIYLMYAFWLFTGLVLIFYFMYRRNRKRSAESLDRKNQARPGRPQPSEQSV